MKAKSAKTAKVKNEEAFHATAQMNAIGGYIGCNGPKCWALIQAISDNNVGRKIQGV